MTVTTYRPNSTISNGNWARTPSGSAIHSILSDNSDSTFISTTSRSQLPSQFAVFDIPDVTLATGAKIFSVRLRVRVLQVPGPSGSSFDYDIIRFFGDFVETVIVEAITGSIFKLFATIFGFFNPKPPPSGSPVWETVELAYYPEKPSGGEWTVDALNTMQFRLGRSDTSGVAAKVSEFYVDVDTNEAPVINVTGPTGPITDRTRPVVTWTYSDTEGDPQAAYRTRVFTEAQYTAGTFNLDTTVPFASTEWVPGQDTSWLVSRDLPNGNYRVYVQVKQVWNGIGDHTSAWDSFDFEQDVPGPPTPNITATPNIVGNWVQIDLSPSSGSPATETYNVEYSDNAGVTWQLVRGGFQIIADVDGQASLLDYEAPLNVARFYRALAFRTLSTIKVASDYSDEISATTRSTDFWMKDPIAPSRNMIVVVFDDKPKRNRSQGVFSPLSAQGNDTYKIVVNGPTYGIEGQLMLVFVGDDLTSGWTAFNELNDPGRTLLFQYPTGEQHYIRLGSEITQEWGMKGRFVQYRKASVQYYEVEKPADPAVPS